MTRAMVIKLLDKMGLAHTSKISVERAGQKITRAIEKNRDLIKNLDLTDEEISYLDELGFEITVKDAPKKTSSKKDEDEEEDEDNDEDDEDEKPSKESSKKTSEKTAESKSTPKKEKSAKTEKAPKANRAEKKREVIDAIVKVIGKKPKTRQQIIEEVLAKVPDANEATIRTYLSDGKNKKYNPFPSLLIEDDKKRLSFEK